MLRKVTLFAVMAAMGLCLPTVSQASGSMKTGGLTSQPIGHYEFCRIYRDQCDRETGDTSPLRLDSKIWSAILNVNSTVNMVIEPKSDIDIYGKEEVWT
ncbi:MAG: transglutaminase-like cysteine peptidase, partial [Oricola sp.]|nr:transglutaminase-like cysteine peptidase [Oricola sp.]